MDKLIEAGLIERLRGHTPGPWEAAERGAYSDFNGDSRVILGDYMRLAVVQTNGRAETEANARLIAAAPDLLAEVEHLSQTVNELREALEKIADGDVPKVHAEKWRDDGQLSKHDKCPHGRWMYEDCDGCVSEFASTALNNSPSSSGEVNATTQQSD